MADHNPHRRLSDEIRAAIDRGALTEQRATHYLAKALDDPAGSAAVARTVSMLWGPGRGISIDGDDPDAVFDTLFGPPPREPRAARWAARPRAAVPAADLEDETEPHEVGPPDAEDIREGAEPGHGPMNAEHTHQHASYAGDGPHSHAHIHRGDNLHAPGAGHGHADLAAMGSPAVTAGIARRTAEHHAAAAQPRVQDMTDAEITAYMGPPPGGR